LKRLTIRNSDGSISQPTDLKWAEALKKLAAYEDMEEQGRLYTMPCKMGDSAYVINGRSILEVYVISFRIHEWGSISVLLLFDHPKKSGSYLYSVNDIGKTWYLNRADAEEAVKGAKNEH